MATASPLGSSSSSRRSSSDSMDSSASSPSKKRKLATLELHLASLAAQSFSTTHKRRSILNEPLDEDMEDPTCNSSTSNKQMSIANLITSPQSDDSFWAATSALADVTIKPEKVEVEMEVEETRKPQSSSNIPAAFLATQAFASPRDFFVALAGVVEPPGPTEKAHVVCTLCQVTMGNRVYSLKRHLFRHHPQVFRVDSPIVTKKLESPPKQVMKREPEVDYRRQSGDHFVVHLKEKFAVGTPVKRSKMGEMDYGSPVRVDSRHNDAFVGWLRSDVIPMKAVQSQLFLDFLALVNPRFKMPQVIVQPQQLHKLSTANLGKGRCAGANRSVDWSGVAAGAEGHAEPRFMRGLCLQGNGMPPVLVSNLIVPTPGPQEALIEVVRAGICGTDLQMIDNYKPGFKGALGHEFVGIVRQLGAHLADDPKAKDAWIGKRVVGEINIPCDERNCSTCSCCMQPVSGDTLTRPEIMRRNHCPNRSCLGIVGKDGAFAEYITLPVANLYEVPDSVVDSHAVFAEPLAAACRIVEQQIIQPTDHVVVLGDGKLGLMVAEVLHATGAAKSVTLVGKHREKLALAKHFVTTVYTLSSSQESDMAALADRIINESAPFDVCVESTGTPGGIAMATKLVRPRGTIIMKSTCSAKRSPVDMRALQGKRLRIVGSRCGPIRWALRLLQERKIDVQKYIHGVYPLGRAEAALAHAATRGTLKIQFIIK